MPDTSTGSPGGPGMLPPVLPPSDHERLLAPRTLLAIGIFALFAATVLLPYFQDVPVGAATNLILTTSEILKAVLLLVVGFYFGTSQSNARKDEVIAAQVTPPPAAAAPAPPAPPASPADGKVNLAPGERLEVQADPASTDGELPLDQRVQP